MYVTSGSFVKADCVIRRMRTRKLSMPSVSKVHHETTIIANGRLTVQSVRDAWERREIGSHHQCHGDLILH